MSADTYQPSADISETAASWLRECDQSHEACGLPMADEVPTRLLWFTGERIRLVHTADLATKPRYATLSHCWGNRQFLKLLKGNLNTFIRDVPRERLPKTFVDALEITTKLGLEYIWIDSLCIIQDDEKDWQLEAGRMSSVYGGSYINIAASSAKGANEGCFLRPESRIEGFRARITADGHTSAVVQFERTTAYRETINNSHLATRAWTFQEKILPSRTLHFGNRGTLWECASKVATEFLREGLCAKRVGMIEDFHQARNPAKLWSQAVDTYSRADITYARDKLPALSGFTKRIHALTGDDYLAGIWRNASIEQQLCWYIHVDLRGLRRRGGPAYFTRSPQPAYRAPSWSWASADDPAVVSAGVEARGLYAHVIDGWTTTTHDRDPFGEVVDGAIRLACSALLAGHVFVDYVHSGDLGFNSPYEDWSKLQYRGDFNIEFESTDQHPCFLVPLVAADLAKSEPARGIVIRRTNRVKGEFKRVGAFWTDCSDTWKAATEFLVKEIDRQGRDTASAECSEIIDNIEHSSESFVITIV
jgi:hypothetical protein